MEKDLEKKENGEREKRAKNTDKTGSTSKTETRFAEAYAIDVSEYIEKKNGFLYLSWARAWAEFKNIYTDANYKINEFDGSFCSGNEKMGYMVQTQVTTNEHTYEMWLPVMDARNHSILQPKMTDVNKAIMRCLTKNLAMFGLGLYIYAGEDLPETPKNPNPLTEKELVEVWQVPDVKKTVAWFENRFNVPFAEWNETLANDARALLKIQKTKRESS